jgi:hypothetical protein
MKRSSLVLAAAFLFACNDTPPEAEGVRQDPIAEAAPNPEGVEPVPAADAPVGTESGGAAVAESEISWAKYGSPITLTDSIKAKALLADPAPHAGQEILVEGTVADVCQKAGCWMVIADGDKTMRVLMKEHGFSVAKDGAGSWARVQGTLQAVEVPKEEVDHLVGESARPELAPETKGMSYRIIATGVEFQQS